MNGDSMYGTVPTTEWKVEDLTPDAKVTPTPEQSVRAEVLTSIRDIVHRRTGVDLTGEFTVDTDEDSGHARITMAGLTLGDGGDLVPAEREYDWTGYIMVRVEVSGRVIAPSFEEAQEMGEYAMAECELSLSAYGEVSVDDWTVEETDICEVSEV